MPMTGTVDVANARIDLFVDYTTEPGTQTSATVVRRVGHVNAPDEYVRGLFGSTLLGEQAYVSDHEAPLDAQIWYVANSNTGTVLVAGPFTIPSDGYVWLKDPGRPWADLKLDLCNSPSRSEAVCDPNPPVISDTFTRVVVDSWGTADTGQTYTNTGTAAANFDVDGTQGTHALTTVSGPHRSTVTQPAADVDVQADMGVTQLAAGGDINSMIIARLVDGNNFYAARLVYTTSQTVSLQLFQRVASVDTVFGTSFSLSYAADQMFTVRMQVQGQNLRARFWPAGTAEPEIWHVTGTSAAFTSAGSVGLRSVRITGNTNSGLLALFDNFTVSSFAAATVDIAWVGFRDKVRAADAGLFPVLDDERPSDVFARRKDITTAIMFLSRSLGALTGIYELFTAGGPLLVQVPIEYGMNAPYGQRDRYYQPDNLTEAYLSQDQRKMYRLWTAPATSVDAPIGEPQGTDTANWCALKDTYATMGAYASSGYSWAEAATGEASTTNLPGLYGSGPYGSGPYGG